MVIVSDAHLIDSVVGRSTELEKSVDVFYNQFNVVSATPTCLKCCLKPQDQSTVKPMAPSRVASLNMIELNCVICSWRMRKRNPTCLPRGRMTGGGSSGRVFPRPSAPTTSGRATLTFWLNATAFLCLCLCYQCLELFGMQHQENRCAPKTLLLHAIKGRTIDIAVRG